MVRPLRAFSKRCRFVRIAGIADRLQRRLSDRAIRAASVVLTFLKNGSLAVVTPIQDDSARRFGFSWWRIETR
jgi:hypothetical protein